MSLTLALPDAHQPEAGRLTIGAALRLHQGQLQRPLEPDRRHKGFDVRFDAIAPRRWVAERLIYRDDHPEAHAMVIGSRRDLAAIMAGRVVPGGL